MQSVTLLVVLVAVGVFNFDVVAEVPTDLQIEDLSAGRPCSEPTKNGDSIYVHYTGRTHPDLGGRVFDSSQHKKPIKFQLGSGRVMRGWDLGLLNMCPGGRRRVTIPPSYGYDADSRPEKLDADATTMFDLELIHIDRESMANKLYPALWFLFCGAMGALGWNHIRSNTIDPVKKDAKKK